MVWMPLARSSGNRTSAKYVMRTLISLGFLVRPRRFIERRTVRKVPIKQLRSSPRQGDEGVVRVAAQLQLLPVHHQRPELERQRQIPPHTQDDGDVCGDSEERESGGGTPAGSESDDEEDRDGNETPLPKCPSDSP